MEISPFSLPFAFPRHCPLAELRRQADKLLIASYYASLSLSGTKRDRSNCWGGACGFRAYSSLVDRGIARWINGHLLDQRQSSAQETKFAGNAFRWT
jgi:hypothetical protein